MINQFVLIRLINILIFTEGSNMYIRSLLICMSLMLSNPIESNPLNRLQKFMIDPINSSILKMGVRCRTQLNLLKTHMFLDMEVNKLLIL